jgi:hypothetical protein
MPTLKCLGCGRDTNTTVCDYIDHDDLQPRHCWAAADYENNVWIKGCGYDALPVGCFERIFADKVIGETLIKSREEILQSIRDICDTDIG